MLKLTYSIKRIFGKWDPYHGGFYLPGEIEKIEIIEGRLIKIWEKGFPCPRICTLGKKKNVLIETVKD